MKKFILKSMFVSSLLLLMTSCASGSYMKTVSFWHEGNFLQFLVLVGIGVFVYLLYDKMQAIDRKLSQLIDLLRGNHNPNSYNVPNSNMNVGQPQQPVQQAPQQSYTQPAPQAPAPQKTMKTCPDCGATYFDADQAVCSNCGCPLN